MAAAPPVLIVNTGVIVAPTAGQNVMYQYQANGIGAIHSGGFSPRMYLGALWFGDTAGTPDTRLRFGMIHRVGSYNAVPILPGMDSPYFQFEGAFTPYPDVNNTVQVLSTGEITLGMNNNTGGAGWCNLVLTVSPEMILPPGFIPDVPT